MFKTDVSINVPARPQAELNGRFGLREGPFTLLLAALTAMTALSIDMSLPALPDLQRSFHAGVSPVQLTLSLFLLAFAGGQIVCGPLSDRWGRRPVLLSGLAVFTLAGLLCAASTSLWMLIACRCLQGLGASAGSVVARAIVRDRFEGARVAAVLSQVTQVMILAPLVAPALGGYLLTVSGWSAIFLTLGGCGAALLLLSWRFVPESAPAQAASAAPLRAVGQGFRTVLTHPGSLWHSLAACCATGGMFAYISGSPFVFMDVFHATRSEFGLYFAMTAGSLMVGATVNRALISRHSPSRLLLVGAGLVVCAGLTLAALASGASPGCWRR